MPNNGPTRGDPANDGSGLPVTAEELGTYSTVRLLPRIAQGDGEAAGVLFERAGSRLRRFARGRLPGWARRRTDTEDLVQESLVRGWKNLDRFQKQPSGSLLRWLNTVLKNLVTDEKRHAMRTGQPEGFPGNPTSHTPSPDRHTLNKERKELFTTALSQLSRDEQAIIRRRSDGDSFAQLARTLGKPSADAARMAHSRALRKLRDVLAALTRHPTSSHNSSPKPTTVDSPT